MNKLFEWFSIERTNGLIMLLLAVLLVFRPFATALDVIEDAWTVTITLSLLRTAIFISSLFLIWKGCVNQKVFLLCHIPVIVYAIALFIIFCFRYNIGAFGFIYGLWACGLSLYVHSKREK